MAAYPKEGRRMLRQLIVLLLAVLVSSACSSYTVPRYGLSAENITGLPKLGAEVNVGRLTATSSNGRSLSVSSKYGFSTGPVFYVGGGGTAAAERACAETAQAFAPAVQVLIGKLVYHPEFAALLK